MTYWSPTQNLDSVTHMRRKHRYGYLIWNFAGGGWIPNLLRPDRVHLRASPPHLLSERWAAPCLLRPRGAHLRAGGGGRDPPCPAPSAHPGRSAHLVRAGDATSRVRLFHCRLFFILFWACVIKTLCIGEIIFKEPSAESIFLFTICNLAKINVQFIYWLLFFRMICTVVEFLFS